MSSRKKKTGIVTIDGEKALEIVRRQRSVGFQYKGRPGEQRYGMIAEEAAEHDYLRDLVSVASMGEEECMVLNTQDVTFLLWAAVREQQETIESLRREIQEIKRAAS